MGSESVIVTREIDAADRAAVQALLAATGFFNGEELDVAMELVDARLDEGPDSHYRFLVARDGGEAIGYACWGAILGTAAAVDLYWIAVHPRWQGKGVGKALLHESEAWIAESGRSRVYIETSGRPLYEPTRAFYLANGYRVEAVIDDFYAPGDGKFLFVRVLPTTG
jgi:GNAT superfamily N-acetyltransferase